MGEVNWVPAVYLAGVMAKHIHLRLVAGGVWSYMAGDAP